MAWLVTSLRRLREAALPTTLLGLVIGVTAFTFAVAPRLLQTTGDSVLRADIAAAAVDVRGLEIVQLDRILPAPTDPLGAVRQAGVDDQAQFPTSVDRLVAATDLVVETPRWRLESPPLQERSLRLRIQPQADARIRFVAGAFPAPSTHPLPAQTPVEPNLSGAPVTVFQAALSVASAAALQAQVGETIVLSLDPTDPQTGRREQALAVEVSGIYAEVDPADAYWFDDPALDHPRIRSLSSLKQVQDVTALLAPAAYPALLDATDQEALPMRYRWRYTVDPARLTAATADGVIADLRRLEGQFSASTGGVQAGAVLQSGLHQLLETHQSSWRAAEVVLSVVAVGPAVVAAAALALVTALTGRRRRGSLGLARARGASRSQLWSSLVLEGALVAVPPALLATALAIVLVPDGRASQTVAGAAIVVVAAVLLVLGTSVTGIRDGRAQEREGAPGRGTSPGRLALEAVVILIAAGGAALLVQRGVRGASSTGELTSADPFIAAVPALVGLAAGLVLRRLYPLVMRLAARLAGVRRDLVPVLAMRRATRGAAGSTILLVLLAAATLGTFASAILVHLDRAADAIAWQDVGAPYALTAPSGPFPPGFAPERLPGVTAASAAYLGPAMIVDRSSPVQLLALDPATYEAMVSGTPAAQALPAGLTGAASGAIPALVATSLLGGPAGFAVGGELRLSVGGAQVGARVVAARDTFPALPADSTFVVVSRPQLQAAMGDTALPTRLWFLAAPDDAAAAMRTVLAAQAPGVVLTSRAEETVALDGRPIVEGVVGGVTAAALVAAAYAGLAVIAALLLAGAARAAEVAHLRLLGLTRRQVLALVIAEHGPMVVVSFAAGVVLGLGLFLLLRPGLGLETVVGSDIAVALEAEPWHLALLLAAIVAIVGAGIAAGTLAQRHATPAAAVRGGLE